MRKNVILIGIAMAALLLAGCGSAKEQTAEGESKAGEYYQISQEEAAAMMSEESGYVIVDVRTEEEYNEGHIPGAILIPNESIVSERPEELPDLYQIILIYCRSGRRSKEAAQKLADMGYVNIYEFGGIIDWTGEITAEEGPAGAEG